MTIDLVCWDFGDTLVDERFMRIPPPDVPAWTDVYEAVINERLDWLGEWDLGRGTIHELIEPLAERLPMTRAAVSRHLRAVWQKIEWYPSSLDWMTRLDGNIAQAVVTVNPFEFTGFATACGIDPLVDVIITSADVGDISKVTMAARARQLLGLEPGLSTTLLIDNRLDNVEEFVAAQGQAYHYTIDGFPRDADGLLGPLL